MQTPTKAPIICVNDCFEYAGLIQVGSCKLISTSTGAGAYKRTSGCACMPVCVLTTRGELLIDPTDTEYCQEPSIYNIGLHHQQGNLISHKILHLIIILKYWNKLLAIHKRLNQSPIRRVLQVNIINYKKLPKLDFFHTCFLLN